MKALDLEHIDLTVSAPETEPQRQFYYMAKAKKQIEAQAEQLGRPLTFCVTTFGCPFV